MTVGYATTRWICQCKPAICGGTFYRYGKPIFCPLWPKCHGNMHQIEFLYPQQSVFQRRIRLADPKRAKRHHDEWQKLRKCFDPEGLKKWQNDRYRKNADVINARKKEKRRLARPPGFEKPPVEIPPPPCGGECDECPYDEDNGCRWASWEEDYLARLAEEKAAAARELKNAKGRAKRANETPEEKAERRAKRNARDKARRVNETPEQKETRLAKQKIYDARSYAKKKAAKEAEKTNEVGRIPSPCGGGDP